MSLRVGVLMGGGSEEREVSIATGKAVIKACNDNGIDIFAISPKEGPKSVYNGADDSYKCVYYNCNPPFDPLVMHPKTEVVYHACEWDRNYLSVEKAKELIEFLKKYDDEPLEFCFMEDLL